MDISVSHPSTAHEPPAQTMRLPQAVSLLRRNALPILLWAALGAAAMFAYSKSLTPSYTAYGAIAIEGQSFAIPELQGAVRSESMTDPMPLVRTEVQALMSRQLIQSVIDKLALDRLPELNPTLRPPTVYQNAKTYVQSVLPTPVGLPSLPPGDNQAIQNEVLRSLVVSQDNRSLVIGVSFTAHDPTLAASVVNTLIQQYLGARVQRRTDNNQDANAEMLQRVASVRLELRRLEAKMRDVRTTNELVGLRAGSIGQQQLEELATAAARSSLERGQIESQWQRATALAQQGVSGNLADVLNSPTIGKLREQEGEASQRLADLSSQHGPSYPGLRSAQATLQAVQSQIATETQRIIASLSTQLNIAQAREVDTKNQLQAARDRGVKAENAQAEFNDLQQEVTAQRALYQSLLQGAQRTIAQNSGSELGLNVRVLSTAVPSADPSSPNAKLATGMGGLSGALVGLLLAFVRGNPADRLSRAGNLVAAAGLPVLATLCRPRNGKALLARTMNDPSGLEAESLRLLRSRLSAGGYSARSRSVVFTTLNEDVDSAAIAAAFAYLAARDGEAVALVEANLPSPNLASILGIKQASYLPLLADNADWRGALLSDQQIKVDFLLETRPASASEDFFSGPRFQNLLIDLHQAYDLTVISGPPESQAATCSLAAEADCVVLVIRAERMALPALHMAAARLTSAARGRVAVVLSSCSRTRLTRR